MDVLVKEDHAVCHAAHGVTDVIYINHRKVHVVSQHVQKLPDFIEIVLVAGRVEKVLGVLHDCLTDSLLVAGLLAMFRDW
jgi:mannose/fructose/N-acetylgalactosamine-specific phosphotransferase system component IIC